MSLDFPNRARWLRVRCTKPRRGRVFHLSRPLVHQKNLDTCMTEVKLGRGVTYNRGRNAAKRAARLKRAA